MLAQTALAVFALFAVLSLIVDVGYARLTQAQMQNAADTAALEGLRTGDRAAANLLVQRVFDDDLDPTNGDPDYQFGAGPVLDVSDGATNLHGLQLIGVPESHVYKPDLQLNADNATYGDFVSGRFCYTAEPGPSEDPAYADRIVCGVPQNGEGAYVRNDFNPGVTGPAAGSAFLVRLRRSNELRDFEGQTEPGVASSGPSLPLVFGKATTIAGDDPAGGYSVRRDGFTVRATAIAETRAAMRVGLPQTNPALPGATSFALVDLCAQNAGGAGVTFTTTINPLTGVITRTGAGTAACPTGAVVGRFVANPAAMNTIGQLLPAAVAVACPAVNSVSGYGPVYSQLTSGTNRVIGFAQIILARGNPCPAAGVPFPATMTRAAPTLAASNATASLMGDLPLPIGAPTADVRDVLTRNALVTYGPVLVAVLAR